MLGLGLRVSVRISVRVRVRVKVLIGKASRCLGQEVLEQEFGNRFISSLLSYLVKWNLCNFNVIADYA